MTTPTTPPRDPAPAVTRALRVLTYLEESAGRPRTLTDIARALDIAKSSALNICTVLEDGGMIRRTDLSYSLGMRTAELGGAFARQFNQVREFFGVAESIPELAGEVVQVAMLDTPDALYIARHEGRQHRLGTPLGSRLPLVHTATGTAMLAAMPDARIEEILREAHYPATTPSSSRTPAQVRAKISAAREAGYAVDRGEGFAGIWGVAAVLEPWQPSDPMLALGVAIPAAEGTDETLARLGPAVLEATRRLTNPLAARA